MPHYTNNPNTTATEHRNVVIVGGGLAGMSSAISLSLAGIKDILIVESAPELREVGAGIQITPNASLALKNWGLEKELSKTAVSPINCYLRRWSDGKELCRFNSNPGHLDQFGSPFWDMHRADLHDALIDKAESLGVEIRVSAKVCDIEFDTPTITISGDSAPVTISSNLVIAADGLYSTCRSKLPITDSNRHEDIPKATGDVAYRIMLTRDQLLDDPELLDMVDNPMVNYWVGPDSHVVSYALRDGELLNIVLLCPDDTAAHVRRETGDVDEMRQVFSNWDPLIKKLLDRVPTVMKWKLLIRPPIDSWVSTGNGRFLMIGDAAHTMLPYLSQGAAQSIEDAAVLGEVVEKAGISLDSLRLYERLRKDRAEKVVVQSAHQRASYHMHDGPNQQARDQMLAKPAAIGDHWQWRDPVFAEWLYGYDYAKDVKDAMATWNYEVHNSAKH